MVNVVEGIVASGNAGAEDLDGSYSHAISGLNFGVGVVADDQRLFGLELIGFQDFLEDFFFPLPVGFIDGVHIDLCKELLKSERPDLAFLETSEPRGYEEKQCLEFLERVKVGITSHFCL